MLIVLLISITFVSLCASSYFPRISRLRGFLCSDYKLQAKQKITHWKRGNEFSEKLLVSIGTSFKEASQKRLKVIFFFRYLLTYA